MLLSQVCHRCVTVETAGEMGRWGSAECSYVMYGRRRNRRAGAGHLLLAIVFRPLTTDPFEDEHRSRIFCSNSMHPCVYTLLRCAPRPVYCFHNSPGSHGDGLLSPPKSGGASFVVLIIFELCFVRFQHGYKYGEGRARADGADCADPTRNKGALKTRIPFVYYPGIFPAGNTRTVPGYLAVNTRACHYPFGYR